MVLARHPERARRKREGSRDGVVEFERRQRLRTVRLTREEDAPIAQPSGGMAGAGRAQGVEGGECAGGGIEQVGGGDGEPAIAGAARDQDRAVMESGGRVAPDRRRQRRSEQRVRPRDGVVDFGRGQRLAGGVPAAGHQHGAVCEQYRGVLRAGLVQVRHRRPGPGRLSRGRRRDAERERQQPPRARKETREKGPWARHREVPLST